MVADHPFSALREFDVVSPAKVGMKEGKGRGLIYGYIDDKYGILGEDNAEETYRRGHTGRKDEKAFDRFMQIVEKNPDYGA